MGTAGLGRACWPTQRPVQMVLMIVLLSWQLRHLVYRCGAASSYARAGPGSVDKGVPHRVFFNWGPGWLQMHPWGPMCIPVFSGRRVLHPIARCQFVFWRKRELFCPGCLDAPKDGGQVGVPRDSERPQVGAPKHKTRKRKLFCLWVPRGTQRQRSGVGTPGFRMAPSGGTQAQNAEAEALLSRVPRGTQR